MKVPFLAATIAFALVHDAVATEQLPFLSKASPALTIAHFSPDKDVQGPTKVRRLLSKILDNFSIAPIPNDADNFSGAKHGVLSVEGKDLEAALPLVNQTLNGAMEPVLFLNLDNKQRHEVFDALNLSVRYVHDDSGSELLLVDWFHDLDRGRHLRLIHLPSGLDKNNIVRSAYSSADNITRGESQKSVHVDAEALEHASDDRLDSIASTVLNDITDYLNACGTFMEDHRTCWSYMQSEFPKIGGGKQQQFNADNNMIPSEGAVWREIIDTTYRSWTVQWGDPFPFSQIQVISHRMNIYWYLYVQAPPHSQLYYAFVLVDSMHNPETQLISDPAIGYTLSNLKLDIKAKDLSGRGNPDDLFWIKSSPTTQNTNHEERRSWSSTDSYSLSMNLGFQGKMISGGLKFNYTKTFTASYSESRDITDWSVVEVTNPVSSEGSWRYFQQWPVDMLQHNVYDFAQNWEKYYSKSWDPCVVHEQPNLSKYALTNHNSMVWAVQPRLLSSDNKTLPIRFSIELEATVSAVTCEIFDGHHKMSQKTVQFEDMNWEVNVADLNNIQV